MVTHVSVSTSPAGLVPVRVPSIQDTRTLRVVLSRSRRRTWCANVWRDMPDRAAMCALTIILAIRKCLAVSVGRASAAITLTSRGRAIVTVVRVSASSVSSTLKVLDATFVKRASSVTPLLNNVPRACATCWAVTPPLKDLHSATVKRVSVLVCPTWKVFLVTDVHSITGRLRLVRDVKLATVTQSAHELLNVTNSMVNASAEMVSAVVAAISAAQTTGVIPQIIRANLVTATRLARPLSNVITRRALAYVCPVWAATSATAVLVVTLVHAFQIANHVENVSTTGIAFCR